MLRIFRPEIQIALRVTALVVLVGSFVLTFAWGYEHRQQAQTWQRVACAYRLREAATRNAAISHVATDPDPCGRLEKIGLRLARPLP